MGNSVYSSVGESSPALQLACKTEFPRSGQVYSILASALTFVMRPTDKALRLPGQKGSWQEESDFAGTGRVIKQTDGASGSSDIWI